jgi:hypothetical protein
MSTQHRLSTLYPHVDNGAMVPYLSLYQLNFITIRDRRGRYRMVVGFITTYVISAYHH